MLPPARRLCSRTTVENAYTRLCIEGIAESVPQRGYFITGNKSFEQKKIKKVLAKEEKFCSDSKVVKRQETTKETTTNHRPL